VARLLGLVTRLVSRSQLAKHSPDSNCEETDWRLLNSDIKSKQSKKKRRERRASEVNDDGLTWVRLFDQIWWSRHQGAIKPGPECIVSRGHGKGQQLAGLVLAFQRQRAGPKHGGRGRKSTVAASS
jgi:hypothetical protein